MYVFLSTFTDASFPAVMEKCTDYNLALANNAASRLTLDWRRCGRAKCNDDESKELARKY